MKKLVTYGFAVCALIAAAVGFAAPAVSGSASYQCQLGYPSFIPDGEIWGCTTSDGYLVCCKVN